MDHHIHFQGRSLASSKRPFSWPIKAMSSKNAHMLARWMHATRWWQGQDRKTFNRINTLIDAACRDPFEEIGKPEPLVSNLAGFWSRRIDDTNRLVYEADEGSVLIVACRLHYDV